MPADGTIDITNTVSNMSDTFVTLAYNYLTGLALAIPGIGPVLTWFIKIFAGPLIKWGLEKLVVWSVMQAFFMNTAIRKASQATDYTEAMKIKLGLPEDVSDEEYANAEAAEMHAFVNFVMVTN